MYPKISIVTVSFNQGKYLEKTILSVLEQDYPNLEYIIIDGGSTDKSVEIIQKYADRLAYWVSEPDSGQSEAIQKGLDKCTGEIFNWLCSDDYLEKGSLNKIGETFHSSGAHIVYGKVREFNEEGTRNEIKIGTRKEPTQSKNIANTFITQPVTFWKTEIVREVGINFQMHWFMDYEMWFRYQLKYGSTHFVEIDELIAHYLFHEKSKSQLENDYTQTLKSSKFKIDMNTILFRFCEYIGYAEKLTVLKSLSTELVSDYVFRPIDQIDERLGKEIVNQYLLSNAKRYYWIKDYSYSAYLFKAIDPDYLEPADLAEYKDLKYRSTNAGLLSFLRKVPGLQGLKKILRNG
jgi:glycosyltransferase involved in cell wall biosynthesis